MSEERFRGQGRWFKVGEGRLLNRLNDFKMESGGSSANYLICFSHFYLLFHSLLLLCLLLFFFFIFSRVSVEFIPQIFIFRTQNFLIISLGTFFYIFIRKQKYINIWVGILVVLMIEMVEDNRSLRGARNRTGKRDQTVD